MVWPDPGLVRFIAAEEIGATHTPCMAARGWTNVRPNAEGTGLQSDPVLPAQQPVFNLARWQCWAMFTPDQRFTDSTPQLHRFIYEYVRDYVIPCLHAHHQTEAMPLPTLEQYVAHPQEYSFYPRGLDPNSAAWRDLVKACPQTPPTSSIGG